MSVGGLCAGGLCAGGFWVGGFWVGDLCAGGIFLRGLATNLGMIAFPKTIPVMTALVAVIHVFLALLKASRGWPEQVRP
jgi:hypothetical protein